MKRSDSQIKTDISIFLHEHSIMTLATSYDDQPWGCTVYYGIDDDLSMYIVTGPKTIHGQNISKNKHIAFTIFDSRQKITDPKKGVQGRGTIEMQNNLVSIAKGLLLWNKANPGIEDKYTAKDIFKKITESRVYKITPTYLKFFNKELYGDAAYGEIEV